MTVNPYEITDYTLSVPELEERLLFWIAAANNNAQTAARGLQRFLEAITGEERPFSTLRQLDKERLGPLLKHCGIGKHTRKAKAFLDAARSGLDLKTCSVDELEGLYGVGMKTARCFIMHSRRDAAVAGLDTHIKKALLLLGHDIDPGKPLSRKEYLAWEEVVVRYAKKLGMTAAALDLRWWTAFKEGRATTETLLQR